MKKMKDSKTATEDDYKSFVIITRSGVLGLVTTELSPDLLVLLFYMTVWCVVYSGAKNCFNDS